MIIVFTDKPILGKHIYSSLQNQYPQETLVFIHSLYFTNVRFNYPSQLKWADYPYVGNPVYRLSPWSDWRACTYELIDNKLEAIPFSINTELVKNTPIIFASDPCAHSVYTFQVFLDYIFGKKDIVATHIKALSLWALDQKSVEESINKNNYFHPDFNELNNAGKVKSYFDYLYNTNSFAIFGAVLKDLGIDNNQYFMSKYMLQLLYEINNLSKNENFVGISEGNMHQLMSHWRGTGKYDRKINDAQLGGCASRSYIIENLMKMGLLKKANIRKRLKVSDLGILFLSKLHKDCMDLDLPFRIQEWYNLPFEEVKPKIDKYIKTFFGKQKRK